MWFACWGVGMGPQRYWVASCTDRYAASPCWALKDHSMQLQETWNEMLNGLWALSRLLMFKCQHICRRWRWKWFWRWLDLNCNHCYDHWCKVFFTYSYYIFLFSNVGFPLFDTLLRCWSFRWSLHKLAILNQHFYRPQDWIFLVACMRLYNPQCWLVDLLVGRSICNA